MRTTLIIHERLARWARVFRPRIDGWGARLIESRSLEDLAVVARIACPVVLIDHAANPRSAIESVLTVRNTAARALVLVCQGSPNADFATVAREAGATLILPATSPLPAVFDVVRCWLVLAGQRALADGWSVDRREEPEPWERFLDDDLQRLALNFEPPPTSS